MLAKSRRLDRDTLLDVVVLFEGEDVDPEPVPIDLSDPLDLRRQAGTKGDIVKAIQANWAVYLCLPIPPTL